MSEIRQLVVIGFGLIGGSVGWGAKERGLCDRLVAVDHPDVLATPRAAALADQRVSAADEAKLKATLAGADLVLLAVPVDRVAALATRCLDLAPGAVTDCGSTKASVIRALARHPRRERFVPGHPMAGRPTGGLIQASPDLFEGRPWALCPGADPAALDPVRRLICGLGALPVELNAEEHDRAVAITSHLPQLLASALKARATDQGALTMAGPGYDSATRVAGGDPLIWRPIFETNAGAIADACRDLAAELEGVAGELEQVPPRLDRALELLQRARTGSGE